ncbi:hypothetical protein KBW71_14935 [Hydrogenophaga aromaticivorans]|jgi:predicted enzyme related to lactoylglutathione lyase|uniref:VOC family protein n=1 Tax=Hydrogenophaga TaxID=47420 RepID=UPI001B380B94|nr:MULTISPECIES: hypothetical protein [Hydrogenophaga]MBU4180134.1 hypothetical protein [Gammaproteobacteria bacterium]MBQ0919733.1 hypothetical protein [Hydrogenophaga aromaticivorans]MBU4282895.1 hypothetical protein [Gammaproteobacteria bacterium]MBU4324765.1 hypothetical protein [Gammaproteobacteria bacterium]MBU4507348.1 hypothetical protein [Gammaproteobacteria bacterium]
MSTSPHAISWFEIPVADFARAKAFYETVLGRGRGFGFFAHFIDTEGNKVGLHSMG